MLRSLVLVLPVLAALCVVPRAATAGIDPVFWLGGGGAPCNFASLPVALGAVPQGAIIRIANNQAYTNINLTISDRSLTLEGGWADCAGTPSSERAILQGAPGAGLPVLRVQAGGSTRFVRLEHLHIRGGTRSGLEVDGLLDVRLADSVVSASSSDAGGGIRVFGVSPQQTVLRLVQSIVGSPQPGVEPGNVASVQGGGVHCRDGRVQLSGALVQQNVADFGGGLSLEGCLLDSGGSFVDLPGFGPLNALVTGNSAEFFGGGVYASLASDLSLDSANRRLIFHANSASRGGGVFLSGAGTRLDGAGVQISSNTADTYGGGAFVENGALLNLHRGNDGKGFCAPRTACSRVIDNEVSPAPTTAASAIQVVSATLTLSQTEVSGNRSINPGQATIFISGGSSTRILNSLLHGNDSGAGRLINLSGVDNNLAISASTIAGNISSSQVVYIGSSAGTAGLRMDRSIIWQPGTEVHNAVVGDEVTSVCMNAHVGSGIDSDTQDPAFVDASIGDFRLHASSPNIDACSDVALGNYVDLLGTGRPIALGDPTTPFDRGAFELTDVIFVDAFDLPKFAKAE